MDLRQLRHFLAVAETLHFGKAAEQLCMTQPPLSQSIMALERELNAPLFWRTKRSVALTPFGEQWLGYVKEAVGRVDALPALAGQLREGAAGQLHLAFVSTAVYNFLPLLVQHYRAAYPQVELTLTELTSEKQIAAVYDGEVHAGIIVHSENNRLPGTLNYRRLDAEPLIAAVPAEWIRQQKITPQAGRIAAREVLDSPLVIFPRQAAPAFYDLVLDYYAQCGGRPQIAQQAIQMQTIISLVSAGMGIALVPASLRNLARADVVYCELSGQAPQLETGLIWRSQGERATLTNLLAVMEGLWRRG